ncbi:hypothetical protein FrCorBMG51_24255, partial [Protofrankia coriariae]
MAGRLAVRRPAVGCRQASGCQQAGGVAGPVRGGVPVDGGPGVHAERALPRPVRCRHHDLDLDRAARRQGQRRLQDEFLDRVEVHLVPGPHGQLDECRAGHHDRGVRDCFKIG